MSRWLSLRRRKTRNRPNSVASSITKSFPKGLAFLSEPEDANVDIVFIHDLTQGRDEAWASVDPADGWPARLSEQGLDKARLVTFGYDVGDVQRIGELFDPSKLRESAEKLLHYYPLHAGWASQANGATNGTAEAGVNGTNGVNGINGANGANGVNGHGDEHNEATAEEHAPAPVGIERPVIFVAHGFGGLIYEQAVALSFEKDQGVGKRRKHASVLLNTPHHGPGIAEWAVICAKELGIPCASSAQLEDWPPFEESIEKLRIIQRLFREAIRQKKSDLHITGAYGTLPTANKLKLASEWASLPDFESIAVEETHFGLTSLRADGEGFKKIASFIVKNASELSTAAADEASAEAAAAEERRLSETTFDRHRDAAAAIIALGLEATKPLAALFNSPQKHSKFMVAYVSKKLEYLLNAFEFLGLQLNKYEAASEERALEDLHLALETCRDSILKLQSETEDFGDISGTDQELQALSDQSGVLDSLIIPVVGDLRRGLDGILDKLLSVSPQTDSSEAALRKQFIKLRRESTHVQDLGARLSTYLPADKLLELEAKATEPSQTLLHCAARSGDVLAVEVLVDMGSNINSRDGEQQTPLHHASQRGDILTVGILLDRGASVEAQDVQGLRPLHLAASKGAGNVVELLLQKGADKDAPDSRARVPLHWAAENNHEAVVQQLIFAKASLGAGDKNARTSLHLAVEYQSEGVAQQLIRANAPIDALDRWSSTPLHIAAQKNSHAVIQQLFQAKASIDAKDQYQRTPLHWAAFRGFEKILTALLEKKADLEAVDSEGHTALQLAVIQGYAGIVQTLLGAGAVKEAQGTAGSVPLHEAISRGYIVLARMLLDDGADIEAKDKNGLTPLRAAMSRGQRDMVNLLVGKGANMDVKDN